MTEATLTSPSTEEDDPTLDNQFQIDVSIEGLPYVLEGEYPSEPANFNLIVSLPPDQWTEIKPKVEANAASSSHFDSQYRRLQSTLHLGEGRVGSVWIRKADTEDQVPAIGISRIQTDNMWLPEDVDYHNARGVGSFLLESLCSLADVRGWRVYLEPIERGGRLDQADLYEWYQRHGFIDTGASPGLQSNAGGMVRLPQEPDPQQPIAGILSN